MDRHHGHKARVYAATLLVLGAYGGLFGRLCVIQGRGAGHYRALAAAQHVSRVRVAERRGTIYDRKGRELAVSVKVASVFADARTFRTAEERARVARRLEELLGVDARVLLRRFEQRLEETVVRSGLTEAEEARLRDRPVIRALGDAVEVADGALRVRPALIEAPGETAKALARLLGRDEGELQAELQGLRPFVWVKRKVSKAERRAVLAAGLAGVGIAPEYKRTYPHKVAAELVGFVGLDEGIEGLELALNDTLAPQPGYAVFRRDATGRYIRDAELPERRAVPGEDVELTLDTVIQSYTEAALAEAWDLWAPKAATAVVLDPRTGDVLAAASLPTFDPNHYAQHDPETLRELCRARYIADWFEPGSIMKAFVLSGVLAERLVSEQTVVFCENGVWVLGSRLFHDHHAYGDLTVAEVIIKSSNIGAAKLGRKLGAQRLHRYLKAFGFGTPTGFPLPGENPGLLRPPSTWRVNYTVPSVSIGQEVCVNVLQMALAYAAIANDGVRMRPRLIRRVLHPDGTWGEQMPRPVGQVIPASIARRVRRVLFHTVEEGTGRQAKLERYGVGGKTGTAQKAGPDGRYLHSKVICSFVAMAPIDRPEVVVIVSVDEPTKHTGGRHFGGVVAAPVVGQILKRTLAYLGVEPDKPQVVARLEGSPTRERTRR